MTRSVSIKFTAAEINHLLAMLDERSRTQWYYGHRGQFELRHRKLTDRLEKALEKA